MAVFLTLLFFSSHPFITEVCKKLTFFHTCQENFPHTLIKMAIFPYFYLLKMSLRTVVLWGTESQNQSLQKASI